MYTSKHYTIEELEELTKDGNLSVFYNSTAWRKLSKYVIKTHNNECHYCKKKGKVTRATIVHHVKPLKEFPKFAYSLTYTDPDGKENLQLIPLCRNCHEAVHHRGAGAVKRDALTPERW